MKRCPQCYQTYENTESFCEVDGQRLLSDPVPPAAGAGTAAAQKSPGAAWATGLIGVLVGIVLCSGIYLAYSLLSASAETAEPNVQRREAQLRDIGETDRRTSSRDVKPVPSPAESPSPATEAAASPAATQSPVDSVPDRLDHGPVSTGETRASDEKAGRPKTVIEMQDGSTVEVDAAWKDAQGIWYRRGGLVSFVEESRVKRITASAEPKVSSAPNQ